MGWASVAGERIPVCSPAGRGAWFPVPLAVMARVTWGLGIWVAGRSEARELLRVLWAPRCLGASASGIDRLVVGLRRVAVVCQDGVVRAALWRGGAAPAG